MPKKAKQYECKYSECKRFFYKTERRSEYCSLECSRLNVERMSSEIRCKISRGRKKYLAENPDSHVWKRRSKFKSEPCEHLKNRLRDAGIEFVEEYSPLVHIGRYFSIDIAFPDEKIAIEVNGNQHYTKDGNLKQYYQLRHDILVDNGWKIIELHYRSVYNIDISDILEFDYTNKDYSKYIQSQAAKQESRECPVCGTVFKKPNKHCSKECSFKNRKGRPGIKKVSWPSKSELSHMIDTMSWCAIGRKFGVSDNSIRKWARAYGIIT